MVNELNPSSRQACSGFAGGLDAPHWPVTMPMDGWLQLNGEQAATLSVHLIDFSARGVGVLLRAPHPVPRGCSGVLITQAHGAGCSYRQVRCCLQRPYGQQQQLQYVELVFEVAR
jgi:hypothetical protein